MKNDQYFYFEWRNINCNGYRIGVKLTEVIKSSRNGRRIIWFKHTNASETDSVSIIELSQPLCRRRNACVMPQAVRCQFLRFSLWFKSSAVRIVPCYSHGTIRTAHTTYGAALKTITHSKTRRRKPYAATQNLMLLMMGVCTQNMPS